MFGGGSDKSIKFLSTMKMKIDQVMMTEGHSFFCNDCDLLSTRTIQINVRKILAVLQAFFSQLHKLR